MLFFFRFGNNQAGGTLSARYGHGHIEVAHGAGEPNRGLVERALAIQGHVQAALRPVPQGGFGREDPGLAPCHCPQGVSEGDFIVMDGTYIQEKCALELEGLELVKDGDTDRIGLGYKVVDIKAVNGESEVVPLLSKAYSYEMGTLSSNNGIKKAVLEAKAHLADKGTWEFDRQGDNEILKDFFFSGCGQCIVRTQKDKQVVERYDIGAVPVVITHRQGERSPPMAGGHEEQKAHKTTVWPGEHTRSRPGRAYGPFWPSSP